MAMRVNGNITGRVSNPKGNLNGTLTTGTVIMGGNGYSKEEVDELLQGKAEVEHDHYVGSSVQNFTLQEAFEFLSNSKVTQYQVNQSINEYAAPKDHTHEDLQSQIDDLKTSVSNGKTLLASAITDKGVETLATDTFQTMADNIKEIPTSGEEDPKPEIPEVKGWVKPEGWPDIKEGMKENQIRLLICDKVMNEKSDYDIELRTASDMLMNSTCTFDWGDGSKPETIGALSGPLKHKFDRENSILYDDGCESYRMYVITIDVLSTLNYLDIPSKNRILWYVDSIVREKSAKYEMNISEENYLQCVELTGNISSFANFKFTNCINLVEIKSNFDININRTDCSYLFQNCRKLVKLPKINLIASATSLSNTFNGCRSLTSLDVSNWDTSEVTSIYDTFYNCSALTSLDLSNWDTNKMTNVKSAFDGCIRLENIGKVQWDLSKFTGASISSKCSSIFYGANLKELDITLQDSVDVTYQSYLPFNITSASSKLNFVKLKYTIPRPTFSLKIELSNNAYKNFNIQRLIITGQEGIDFKAASPQITLDYTHAFKEDAINEFFTNLPTVTNSPTISLKGNPHAGYANMGIALEKGWNVMYDSSTNSASIVPLGDEESVAISPLAYRFIPEEDGTFVDANGNKCNLLYSQSVATMNPIGWEMFPTFDDALSQYGIEVDEEHREEIAREVLDYANDNSLMIRYNIED